MSRSTEQQVVHFLSDMYSVELQALAQLDSAPGIAGDPEVAAAHRQHYQETQQQADLVRDRLEACGGSPSAVKDAVMRLGGEGFLLFARVQPETPGKLVAHSYSYEAMEWAGYEMLARMAEEAGDGPTLEAAKTIGAQERTMMGRLERLFDAAEQASHSQTPPDKLEDHVRWHLAEAHALMAQNMQLMDRSERIAGGAELAQVYRREREQTQSHARLVEDRLKELGGNASMVEDAALRLGGRGWGMFFQAQSDTPAKLAAFAYALEHLLIGGSELLLRTARRAGDTQTEDLAARVLAEQRSSGDRLAAEFNSAVRTTLESLGR